MKHILECCPAEDPGQEKERQFRQPVRRTCPPSDGYEKNREGGVNCKRPKMSHASIVVECVRERQHGPWDVRSGQVAVRNLERNPRMSFG